MSLNLTDYYRSIQKRSPIYIQNLTSLEDYCFNKTTEFQVGKYSFKWFIYSIQEKVDKKDAQTIFLTAILEMNLIGECYSDVQNLQIYKTYKSLIFHDKK